MAYRENILVIAILSLVEPKALRKSMWHPSSFIERCVTVKSKGYTGQQQERKIMIFFSFVFIV